MKLEDLRVGELIRCTTRGCACNARIYSVESEIIVKEEFSYAIVKALTGKHKGETETLTMHDARWFEEVPGEMAKVLYCEEELQ